MAKPNIRLLVTDLDGTLLGHRDDRSFYPAFKVLIDNLREERALRWVLYTGRSYASFQSFTRSLSRDGIYADRLITGGGAIFERARNGYRFKLGDSCRVIIASFLGYGRARRTLRYAHRHLLTSVRGARRILRLRDRFVLRFSTLDSAQDAMHWVTRAIGDNPALKAKQTDREIQVEQVPCLKGYAVRFLARHLGIPREATLLITDSWSDKCLLDRRMASHTGCPLNADDETKQAVRELGGHNSNQFTMAGVIDVVQATLADSISSKVPPEPDGVPRRRRSRRRRETHAASRGGHNKMLLGAALLMTVLVFARFGVLPFSEVIMKPINIVLRGLARLSSSWF